MSKSAAYYCSAPLNGTSSVASITKLITAVIYGYPKKASVCPGKHFQPSLVFAGKARSLLKSGTHER